MCNIDYLTGLYLGDIRVSTLPIITIMNRRYLHHANRYNELRRANRSAY